MNQKKLIIQIAAAYMGTIVGAGFATGQSIMQFFTMYGQPGTAGILITTFLFIWIGTKMMIMAHRIGAFSYQELNEHLFGKRLGSIINVLTLLFLFAVTAVMLSGSGSIFEEQLHLPQQAGVLLMILLSYPVLQKDTRGILTVNSFVAPLMLGFSFLIAMLVIGPGGLFHPAETGAAEPAGTQWLFSPFVYVSLNVAISQAVLVPLGSAAENEKVLKWGGFLGGLGIGFMLWVSHLAMMTEMPHILRFEIPMAEIIRDLGPYLHFLFVLVILGEIFTTLVGNVYGMARQMQKVSNFSPNVIILFTLLVCLIVSQADFTSLVSRLYPLIGYLGLALLLLLALRRLPG